MQVYGSVQQLLGIDNQYLSMLSQWQQDYHTVAPKSTLKEVVK